MSGLLIFFGVLMIPLTIGAKTSEYTPYLYVSEQYSDNIFFSSSNPEKDFITIATAGFLFRHTAARLRAKFDGAIEQLFYQDNTAFNGTEGQALASLNYQLTERVGLGGSFGYYRDLRKDRIFNNSGLIDNKNGDRNTINFNVTSSYTFSEITQGEMRIGYENIQLDDSTGDESTAVFTMGLSLNRNLSRYFKNINGLLNFSYRHYASDRQYDVNPQVSNSQDYQADIFQLYAGFSKQLTALFSCYAQVGGSYTANRERTRIRQLIFGNVVEFPNQVDDEKLGAVILSGITYKGLYTNVGVSLSHDINEGTGTTGTVERSKIGLDIRREITKALSFTLNASVYRNTGERTLREDINRLSFSCQPGLFYKFTNTWTVSGHYRFISTEDRENHLTTKRNLIYFKLRKDFDL